VSVAVGFGAAVKVVSVGHAYFDRSPDGPLGLGGVGLAGGDGRLQRAVGLGVGVGGRRKKALSASGRGASSSLGGGGGGGGGGSLGGRGSGSGSVWEGGGVGSYGC
jgi:hypothetical protein